MPSNHVIGHSHALLEKVGWARWELMKHLFIAHKVPVVALLPESLWGLLLRHQEEHWGVLSGDWRSLARAPVRQSVPVVQAGDEGSPEEGARQDGHRDIGT